VPPEFRVTLGYDWEIPVIKPGGTPMEEKDIQRLTDRLTLEFPYVHSEMQDGYYEHKVGVCRSFPELHEKTEESLARMRELVAEEGASLYCSATVPTLGWVTGCHLHVGTFFDPREAVATRNALVPYMPAFAALMANSPTFRGSGGEYKSHRVAWQAMGDGTFASARHEDACPGEWGNDVGVRMPSPTMECRVVDTPLSARLACECAVLYAALTATLRSKPALRAVLDAATMDTYARNRHRAVRHGLQATLEWDGRQVAARDILRRMLDLAAEQLRELGLPEPNLLLSALAKRQTQADMQRVMLEAQPDPECLIATWSRASMLDGAFEEYLARAPELEQLPLEDPEEFVRSRLGADAPRELVEFRLPLTAAGKDRLVERLAAWGPRPAAVPGTPPRLELMWAPVATHPSGAPAPEESKAIGAEAAAGTPGCWAWQTWMGTAIGVGARAYGELRERLAAVREASRLAAERRGVVLAPTSGVSEVHMAPGLRIVSATLTSHSDGYTLLEHFRPVLPALAALMAGSYAKTGSAHGPVKSARLWCGWSGGFARRSLIEPLDPQTSARRVASSDESDPPTQYRQGRLTLGINCCDLPSSSELCAAACLLVRALAEAYGNRSRPASPVTPEHLVEVCENWAAACLDGLQATMRIRGIGVPAAEVVHGCIADAEPFLAPLGASRDDLWLIERALAKRQSCADMQAATEAGEPDEGVRRARRARIASRDSAFEEYLARAPELPQLPVRSVRDLMLAPTGLRTPPWMMVEGILLPLAASHRLLLELEREGLVRIDWEERDGPVVTRLAKARCSASGA